MAEFPFLAQIIACLRFFSRLPMPDVAPEAAPYAMFDFGRDAAAVPVAGMLIGTIGALALIVAHLMHLPPLVAALLALATLIILTGALHEDGLADCADGFGGGKTREDKLAIMKDSRIGTYGTLALVLSLGLRAATLMTLLEQSGRAGVVAITAAAALSRTLSLLPLALLDPARASGAGHAAARPRGLPLVSALALALIIGFLPMLAGFGFGHLLAAMSTSVLAALAMTGLAYRMIGGQTGDVAGAVQQLAEIAFLCALAAAPGL